MPDRDAELNWTPRPCELMEKIPPRTQNDYYPFVLSKYRSILPTEKLAREAASEATVQLMNAPTKLIEAPPLSLLESNPIAFREHARKLLVSFACSNIMTCIGTSHKGHCATNETRLGGISSIGKWLAWKDHHVRAGTSDLYGLRGPGLGILCLRTAHTDNEMRLWSAVADLLDATPEWLLEFQWAGPEKAAAKLAELLGNRKADPNISLSSAPDIVVIFDEGNLTQRRINPIFPDDFRGNWHDLLNPTKGNPAAPWPLDRALSELDAGPLRNVRFIIVYGEPTVEPTQAPEGITGEELDLLARMAVYRFGFSKQAAYAAINYDKSEAPRIRWSYVDEKIRDFASSGILPA